MRRDSRLSVALHALLHMADANPVVIRRTMGGLRAVGIVRSEKGHGGGWSLARKLEDVSLYDVYEALGEPTIFAIGNRTESPGCAVEKAVNRTLEEALEKAQALLVAQLRDVKISEIEKEVNRARRDHHRR